MPGWPNVARIRADVARIRAIPANSSDRAIFGLCAVFGLPQPWLARCLGASGLRKGALVDTGEIDKVVEGMSTALRRKYEVARELLATTTGDDVRGRYKVAVLVLEVKKNEKAYGAGAVRKLGKALGWDKSTLYRYALIAKRWDAPAMSALVRRKSLHGQPVSWSHLLEVVRVSPPSRRAKLLDRVLEEGLSVRELARLVRQSTAEPDAEESTDVGESVAGDLARVIRAAEAFTARSAEVDEALLQMARLPVQAREGVREMLRGAVKAQEKAQEAGKRLLEHLREAEANLKQAREDREPKAPPHRNGVVRPPIGLSPHMLAGGQ